MKKTTRSTDLGHANPQQVATVYSSIYYYSNYLSVLPVHIPTWVFRLSAQVVYQTINRYVYYILKYIL